MINPRTKPMIEQVRPPVPTPCLDFLFPITASIIPTIASTILGTPQKVMQKQQSMERNIQELQERYNELAEQAFNTPKPAEEEHD